MRTGRVIMGIFGAIFALLAIALLIGGGALLWAYQTQRGPDGFFNTSMFWVSSDGHAVVTSAADMGTHPGDWWPMDEDLTVRLRARTAGGEEIFLGIASERDLEGYLDDVARDEVDGFRDDPHTFSDLRTTFRAGGVPPALPGDQTFWIASVQGDGEQILDWDLEPGVWSAVIMNADGSAPVAVSVSVGGRAPILYPISLGLLAAGLLFAAVASLLLLGATRRLEPRAEAGAVPLAGGPYPATLSGTLDTRLSPALWLVKWFLVIPHMIVLAFLWAAWCILTFFAWVSILFTGRYPRGIFDFNLGVMRWSWRVSFYAYSALGTDQYPPFTLQDVDYPARFSVAYPDRLSPGLALVKWWLLAIPHYIIVGIFSSGLVFWTSEVGGPATDNPVFEIGGGLIAVLVLIAGVVLLFTGRYPRSLFDLLMGLNRWVFRVWAYAGLMTDEYPPFRLDLGGDEPDHIATPEPAQDEEVSSP